MKLRYKIAQGFMDAICLIKLGKFFGAFGMAAFKWQKKKKKEQTNKTNINFWSQLRLDLSPSRVRGKHHFPAPHIENYVLEE